MKSNKKLNFKQVLSLEACKQNIELSDKMLNRFQIYKELLLQWNNNVNLTAITDEYEIILKHFVDSLECIKYIKKGSNIIDIGTGAGFPGIVIAIYFDNNVEMTLLDSNNKRLAFLKELVEKLELNKIEIIHGRAEDVANKVEFRNKYDIAVSRAVAPLNILLEYDIAYLKINGRCLLLKGDNVNEEIEISQKAFDILKCKVLNIYNYKYSVKEEEYSRNIVEILKLDKTPNNYPRNYGRMKKIPL